MRSIFSFTRLSFKYVNCKWKDFILFSWSICRAFRKKCVAPIDPNWRTRRTSFLTIRSLNRPWWINRKSLNVRHSDRWHRSWTSPSRDHQQQHSHLSHPAKEHRNRVWSTFANKLLLHQLNLPAFKPLNSNRFKLGQDEPFVFFRSTFVSLGRRLLRLLCTCCLALRPCTIPLNELNESLLYKQTIDFDSFKYLVEPMFNTPTLERRTAPSFGTWLTGAQYIVTQMERVSALMRLIVFPHSTIAAIVFQFSLIKSNSPRPARIKESDLERLVQQRCVVRRRTSTYIKIDV